MPPPTGNDPVKVRFKAPQRAKSDSVGSVLDELDKGTAPSQPMHGVSTQKDLEEVRALFNDVAAVHVSQVRDVMLELHYGDASASWIEATKPALRSLRAMAEQLELADLCKALDEFCNAVDQTVGRGATIGRVAQRNAAIRRRNGTWRPNGWAAIAKRTGRIDPPIR